MAKVGFKTFCSAPLSLLAFAVFAAFPSGVFGYTSASYEQSGLIAQWDAIDNAGTGVHDPTATVWKDLKGTYDLSLLPKGSWSASGNAFVVNGASAVCSNSLPAYKTIEVVYKMTKPEGKTLFNSGGENLGDNWCAFRTILFNGGNGDLSGTNVYFSISGYEAPIVAWNSFDPSAVRSMSATYSADNTGGQWGRQYGNVEKVYAYGVALTTMAPAPDIGGAQATDIS